LYYKLPNILSGKELIALEHQHVCNDFKTTIIRKDESRLKELSDLGLEYTIISVRKKNSYFIRGPYIPMTKKGNSYPKRWFKI